MPLKNVIRTSVRKKLWRPDRLSPGNCMDDDHKFAYKFTNKLVSDQANVATAMDCVAGSTGLEPAASGVTGRRSNQTELRPLESGDMVGDTRIELVTYGL